MASQIKNKQGFRKADGWRQMEMMANVFLKDSTYSEKYRLCRACLTVGEQWELRGMRSVFWRGM